VPLSACNLSFIYATAPKRSTFFSLCAAFVPEQAVLVPDLRRLTTAWTKFIPPVGILVRMHSILREKRDIARKEGTIDPVPERRNLGRFWEKKGRFFSLQCHMTQ
jgi:hypothetical protein